MKTAYIDCFAGVSGDMFLGALVDAGWPLADLQATVDALALGNVRVTAEHVRKHGLAATHVDVLAPDAQPLRHPADLERIITAADLPEAVKDRSLAVIRALAEAEAQVHGEPVEHIHFHEVGAVDTLVDVVGTIAGLTALGIERVVASPIPWSHGQIRIQHGVYPVPPPAVAALLVGAPVIGLDEQGETVTPTGAALVTGLADQFGLMPALQIETLGYGAGTRDWPQRPNVLRLVIGEAQTGRQTETLTMLACNLDDMVGEWYGPLMEGALADGALDVWFTPAHMKKGRPAVIVEVLCRATDAPALRERLLRHTTTLGVREYAVTRSALPREIRTVTTPFGDVRVKVAQVGAGLQKAAPEHDDCVARAAEHDVSVREVWLAALRADF